MDKIKSIIKAVIISISISLIFLILIIVGIIFNKADNGFSELEFANYKDSQSFSINDLPIDSSTTISNFPFNKYLSSIKFQKINEIHKSVFDLAFVLKDTLLAQDIIELALTKKLQLSKNIHSYDSLRMILAWADKIYAYSIKDKETKYFYKAINSYWYEYVVKELEKKEQDKYLFTYKYIMQRCIEQKYYPTQKKSNIDKIFNYTIEKKWTYLFSRFWNGTGLLFKLIIFVGGILTLLSYICLITKIKFKRKNE